MAHAGTDRLEDAAALAAPIGVSGLLVASLQSPSVSSASGESDEDSSEQVDGRDDDDSPPRCRTPTFSLSTPRTAQGSEEVGGENVGVVSARSARSEPGSARSPGGNISARSGGRQKKKNSLTSQYALLDQRHSINEQLKASAREWPIDAEYAMLERRHSINQELSNSAAEQLQLWQPVDADDGRRKSVDAVHTQCKMPGHRHSIIQGGLAGGSSGHSSLSSEVDGPVKKETEAFELAGDAEYHDDRRKSLNDIDDAYAILSSRMSINDRLSAHQVSLTSIPRLKCLSRLGVAKELQTLGEEEGNDSNEISQASSFENSLRPRDAEVAAVIIRIVLARVAATSHRSVRRKALELEVKEVLRLLYVRSLAADAKQLPAAQPGEDVSSMDVLGDALYRSNSFLSPRTTALRDSVTMAAEVPWQHSLSSLSLSHSDSYELLDESSSPSGGTDHLRDSHVSFGHIDSDVPRTSGSDDEGPATARVPATVDADDASLSHMGHALASFSTSVYDALNFEGLLSFLPSAVDGGGGNGDSPRFRRVSTNEFFGRFPSDAMVETYSHKIINDGPDRMLWPIEEEESAAVLAPIEEEKSAESALCDEEERATRPSSSHLARSATSSRSSGGGASSPSGVCSPQAQEDEDYRAPTAEDAEGRGNSRQCLASDDVGFRHCRGESWGSSSSFGCDDELLLPDRGGSSSTHRPTPDQSSLPGRMFALIASDIHIMFCQCNGSRGR